MTEPVSVEEFIQDTLKDIHSPSESEFSTKISSIRQTIHSLDEGLETDRSILSKSRKFVKSVVSSGLGYAASTLALCDHLENLGQFALEPVDTNGSDLTAGFCQFSVIHRDLGIMFKHLMQNLNSILVFPMETFLQGDLKSDLKKPFDKALKEYEYKYEKLKKEKLQAMKESGVYTPETFTVEMAENLEKERRRLQLEVCEYFIKVNEVKSKKGADFLQHFIDFYHTHLHYLKECVEVMEHFGKKMPDLANRISSLQKQHDTQKRHLVDTRECVRKLLEKEPTKKPRNIAFNSVQAAPSCGYPSTQTVPVNLSYGTQKSGFLLKKSDGKVKRIWQRRRVCVSDHELCLYHADESKPPVRLMLLTCQLKLPGEHPSPNVSAPVDQSGDTPDTASSVARRSFFLVSNNRTYHFQAEDDKDFAEWTSVLSNAMQAVFNEAMNSGGQGHASNGLDMYTSSHHSRGSSITGSEVDLLVSHAVAPSSLSRSSTGGSGDAANVLTGAQLHQAIQRIMRTKVPGNHICADCGRPDPEWVSVNLGVLICLECCGTHRELGVQCSRTQSLLMDDLSTSQLLLPRFIGNRLFNDVYESSLSETTKPTASSDSASRRNFIRCKYQEKKFITSTMGCLNTIGRRRRTSMDTTITADTSLSSSDVDRFLKRDLLRAIRTGDLSTLIQVHAEGLDLTAPIDVVDDSGTSVVGNTALHFTIENAAVDGILGSSPYLYLSILEFIIQNSSAQNLQRENAMGETPLHYAAKFASADAIRLLLCIGGTPTAMISATNMLDQTPLDVVRVKLKTETNQKKVGQLRQCERLLLLAQDCSSEALKSGGLSFASTTADAEMAAQKRLVDAIDDLETVQWGVDVTAATIATSLMKRSNSVQEDSLSRAIGETIAGAIGVSGPIANGPQGSTAASPKRTPLSFNLRSNSTNSAACHSPKYGGALATIPRKKGPAPKPPSDVSWFSISTDASTSEHTPASLSRRLSGGCASLFTRSSRTYASTLAAPIPDPIGDHIDVLLDVLEEHPTCDSFSNEADNKEVEPSRQSPGQASLQRAIALYDCDAENSDELTFKKGEVIIVVRDVEQYWWEGYIENEPSRRGLFPLTYVKLQPPSTDTN
uniref:PH domain-containing protein n=3 Tax=Mesocestoides corti TaxID=53468 RepID=A0A5K3FKS2_MESCO